MTKNKVARERLHYLKTEMFCYNENCRLLKQQARLTTMQIQYIQHIVSSIELALKITEQTSFGEQKRKLIEDMYWHSRSLNQNGLALKHYIHVNTVAKWEKEFFRLLSDLVGVIITFN